MGDTARLNQQLEHSDQPYEIPRVRVPIRTKIIIPYLILAAMLALGAAYLITQVVFDSLEERFTNQLVETGKLASEWMVREEVRLLETINLIANTTGVPEAMTARDADSLRALTFGIAVGKSEEDVVFLDPQGYLLLSMHHIKGGNIEEFVFARDGDQSFTQFDFVNQTLQREDDGYSDKYAGVSTLPPEDTFFIAGPVTTPEGELVGLVLVGKSLSSMVREVRQETLSQVTLYDYSGQVLASTLSSPQEMRGEYVSSTLSMQDNSSATRSLSDSREFQAMNLNYAEILGPWEVRRNEDLGVLGTSLSKTFLISPNRVTRIRIVLLVGTSFLLIILMGVQLARLITRPLLNLVQASRQVASGDLHVQLETKSSDEVAVLTETFNSMVRNLDETKNQLLHAYDSTLEGWSKALELRDKETEGHTLRVTQMTMDLARRLSIPEIDLVQVQRGALLHDIGKMGIPDSILLKPGKLDAQEWELMKQHPQFAVDMLYPIEYLRPALDIPYYHHERWDGTGYPKQLKGEEIPIAARIFAVADVWDALISERPYKKAWKPEDAYTEIALQKGRQFDPQVVDIFLEYIAETIQVPHLNPGT
jgi:putative nucleotidyltransferase with HDIG domain